MKTESHAVLCCDALSVKESRADISGRSCGRVICEALAEAAMRGDIKASELLMELAGEDVKSRELALKHQADQMPLPRIEEVRP